MLSLRSKRESEQYKSFLDGRLVLMATKNPARRSYLLCSKSYFTNQGIRRACQRIAKSAQASLRPLLLTQSIINLVKSTHTYLTRVKISCQRRHSWQEYCLPQWNGTHTYFTENTYVLLYSLLLIRSKFACSLPRRLLGSKQFQSYLIKANSISM